MVLVGILLFISFIALLFYYYFKVKFDYWKNLNVPYLKPRIPYGNIQGHRRILHSSQVFSKFYYDLKGKGKFGGIYFFTNPVAFVTDLDFLKNVLIKDFQYFQDRGMYYNEKDDPLSGHLLNIEGEKWKRLREKLTPTFTSGKIKTMVPTIVEVAERLKISLTKTIESNAEPEIKDILARFTTDIIGSCAFGIECNSLEDPEARFLEMGLKVFQQPRNSFIKQIICVTYPNFGRKMGIKLVRDDVSEFFMKVVRDVVEYREKNNVKRNDFMDLLLQLKNEGRLNDDNKNDKKIEKLTLEEIAAQVFVFFLAGFETSSTTMTFCLHELSLNQEIQEKARQNVLDALEKHDGKITYESIADMNYLELCVSETLRKFPPGATLIRKATKDYKVPDSNVVLKKGSTVMASVYAIQHDPEFYPDPEEFIPERFTPEEVAKRHPLSYLPFGEGPRNCIGMRFGIVETKIGMAMLLKSFRFHKSEKTQIPLSFSKKNIVLSPDGGLFLRVETI